MTRLGCLLPDPGPGRAAALRTAHAQVRAYRLMGRQVPARLELLEREYQRWRKRVQRGLSRDVSVRASKLAGRRSRAA